MKSTPFNLILLVFLISSCTASRLVVPDETTLDRAIEFFPNVTLAQLKEGKLTFQNHCNACHSYKTSLNKSEGKYFMTVPHMAKKVNEQKGRNTITEAQQEAIIRYLVSVSTFKFE